MRRGYFEVLAPVVLGCSTAAQAQAPAPTNNFLASVNGMFRLCPALTRTGEVPSVADLEALGYKQVPAATTGDLWFDGIFKDGKLDVRLESITRRCTVNFVGSGYNQVAGVARDLLVKNGLTRVTGGTTNGAAGNVFEGPTPKGHFIGRFIIIENPTSHSAAVSYTERAAS